MMKFKAIYGMLLALMLGMMSVSCSDDDSSDATLSFSRSIYILPAIGQLEVELKASVAPESDLSIPISIEGSAVLNEDYEISAREFILKAGETSAKITLTPKDNLTKGREIRLAIAPSGNYALGDKKVAIIPVETKERIMYSFTASYSRMMSNVEIWVELQGETTGKKFVAPTDINLPITIDQASTAVLGTDFEFADDNATITIKKNARQAHFTLKIAEGASDFAGKQAILKLNVPQENADLYYAGSFASLTVKLDQLKFIDLLGKWAPNKIIDQDTYVVAEIPESDYVGKLPENNDPNDYLEFSHNEATNEDQIIPHLKGDLKNFFCNNLGHTVTFDHIEKGIYNWATFEEYDAPYFNVTDVNKNFSANKSTIGTATIGLDKVDDDHIVVYFHDYIPTEFFSQTYTDYGNWFDASFFGLTYTFTRVKE